MRIIDETKLDFQDVLIVPKRSTLTSRKEVILTRTFKFINTNDKEFACCPIVASNMDGVGTFEMARALGKHNSLATLSKYYKTDDYIKEEDVVDFLLIPTIGIKPEELDFIDGLKEIFPYIPFIHIDVANGYMQKFVDFCKCTKDKNPNSIIIAGSVVTPEITEELILNAGVDIVRIGIGSGAACTTRIKTGIGYPQLSAVIECADAAHGVGGHIMSDGGCVYPGDIVKAFAGGADFVMLGTMLAGHSEGGFKPFGDNIFYGMSSHKAMEKHVGEVADHKTSEGRTIKIPFKGSVDNTMKDILGGLRSACTYCGAKTIKELPKRTTFITVNRQLNESVKHLEIKE